MIGGDLKCHKHGIRSYRLACEHIRKGNGIDAAHIDATYILCDECLKWLTVNKPALAFKVYPTCKECLWLAGYSV